MRLLPPQPTGLPQLAPRVWSNATYNFDNIFNAFVALFVTMSLNGYQEIMDDAMAAPAQKGLQARAPHPLSSLGLSD